jgi:EAL and modified HD-GYP domain-containing signal transduction protein
MSDVLVGRQPIFDRRLAVHGYELLFRGPPVDLEDPVKADCATSKVLVSTFTEIGLQALVSDHRAFVNLPRSFIVGEHPLPFEPKNVVLEVLETVRSEPDVIRGLEQLKDRGFAIALDDYVYRSGDAALIELADLVKVDVLGLSDEEVLAQVQTLRPFDVDLLAEKIETREQFESCKAMGFRYFQGFFLERPSVLRKRSIDPQARTLLMLLHELHNRDFTFQKAEDIVKSDLGLCYRFLRHINSALYGMPREITSVREALVYLGIDNSQNLTSLFLLASNPDTPSVMITSSMLRARMCENLARACGAPGHHQFFIVGLFSVLDALMEMPMDTLLERLPLSAEQKAALANEPGLMTDALRTVTAFERGDWDRVGFADLPLADIQAGYLEALEWVRTMSEADVFRAA